MYEIKISLQMLYEKLSARCAAEAHIERRERCITDLRLTVPEAGTANRSYVYLCRGSVPGHTVFRHPDGEIEVAAEWVDAANAAMEIFGSYINKDRRLMSEAVSVTALNTVVAILAGLIIFPACFAYGVTPDSGPSLVFVTLPLVFAQMPLGSLWGALFFVFMSFAALSTVIPVFENLISFSMDKWEISRRRAVAINGILVLVLSLPCALGFNVLSDVTIPAIGDIQSIEDFIVSNNMLPLIWKTSL